MKRARSHTHMDLRQEVDRLSVELLLAEGTILRMALEFLEEKELGDEFVRDLKRRAR